MTEVKQGSHSTWMSCMKDQWSDRSQQRGMACWQLHHEYLQPRLSLRLWELSLPSPLQVWHIQHPMCAGVRTLLSQLMLTVHFYNTIRYVYFTVRSQSNVFVPLSYHKLVIVCSYITSQRCACYTVTSRLNVFIALWHHNWKLTDFNAVCFPCQTVFWIEDSGWNKKKKV